MSTGPSSPPIARRDHGGVVPAGLVTLGLESGALRSRDGHELRLRCQVPVRLHDADVDRNTFADRFLRTRVTATGDDVAGVLAREMAPAFENVAETHDAATLLDHPPEDLFASLDAAARRAAFGIGLEITGPLTLTAESPSLARRRVEEAAEAARLAAAEREGELLRRFEDIRRQNPTVPAGAMLMGIADPERREVLLALLKAEGRVRYAPLYVVAGAGLFRVDIEADDVEPLQLPGELGPVRSIRAIRRASKAALLVGARDGVYLVDPADPLSAEAFGENATDSAHGFSHLAYDGSNDLICARHTDAGFVSWQVGIGTRLVYSAEDFHGHDPSSVAAGDGQVFVGAGSAVYTVIPGAPPERIFDRGAGRAAFLRIIGPDLVVVWQDGTITHQRIAGGRPEGVGEGPAHVVAFEPCALGSLPWLGDQRLILGPGGRGDVAMLGIHDDVRLTYRSPSGSPKAIAAAPGVIAGISEDRQRLLAWRPWEQEPFADLHLISRLRGRAADLAFLSDIDASIRI